MSPKYLTWADFKKLSTDFPQLVSPANFETLQDTIGTYASRILEIYPEAQQEINSWEAHEFIMENPSPVGYKVAEILNLSTSSETVAATIGEYYMTEILRNRRDQSMWRSHDGELVYDYTLLDHGDTSIGCINPQTNSSEYLSFTQSIYPFALTLAAFIHAFDPTGENTLGKWDWENTYFNKSNFWKGQVKVLNSDDLKSFHIFGKWLHQAVPTSHTEHLSFTARNKKICYPVLNVDERKLYFYTSDNSGIVTIGNIWKFSAKFTLAFEDTKPMLDALARLIARDPRELLYAIQEYFPEYYQAFAARHTQV